MSSVRQDAAPKSFEDVLNDENNYLASLEKERRNLDEKPSEPFPKVGLAFSGGGIRSATFNLGVLQGLAEMNFLRRIDYLSTVSGGGYIGAWLSAWIQRDGFDAVQKALATSGARSSTVTRQSSEPETIRFLRQFSNYLTPRFGVFSADTWTIASIYLRNLFLNMTILIPFLACVLLVPRFLVWGVLAVSPVGSGAIGLALLVLALTVIGLNLRQYTNGLLNAGERPPWWTRQSWLLMTVVVPLWLTAVLWAALPVKDPQIWQNVRNMAARILGQQVSEPWAWAMFGAAAYGLLWLPALVAPQGNEGNAPCGKKLDSPWSKRLFGLFALPAGALGGIVAYELRYVMAEPSVADHGSWPVLLFGPPLLLAIFSTISVLHIGLIDSHHENSEREWWGRLGAWVLITMAVWLAVYGLGVYAPLLVHYSGGVIGQWSQEGLALGWLGTSVVAVLEGRKGERSKGRGILSKLLLGIAPFVFVVGLLVLLSTALHHILVSLSGSTDLPSIPSLSLLERHYRVVLTDSLGFPLLLVSGVALAVMLAMSWRVDINEFSMHGFYRNRLTRAYLGASNPKRAPQPFTKLANDDLALADLGDRTGSLGPYHIINTTLNLTAPKNLAWQQRKAGSFVFTPRHCGYSLQHDEPSAFTDTRSFADGISLGTAMAISGAAATPNMGCYSSPALAFLMTVFNVRLGWWVGNPKFPKHRVRTEPGFDLYYWLAELFGTTNEDDNYLYLSDGGHFENLGIYELVRRRCRLIIAGDAGADPARQFSDLGNAIEKIRNDLGIDIELNVDALEPGENGRSQWHALVGKIRYDRTDSGDHLEDSGTLVYIKSTLTGNEPTDVLRYAKEHPCFPNESTGDQWFSESQFESYRALGYHSAKSVLSPLGDHAELGDLTLEAVCTRLRERWYPPSPSVALHFSEHTAEFAKLLELLRTEKNLEFLDEQVYTELEDIRSRQPDVKKSAAKPRKARETSEKERRQGFYFCNQMIQLMENVYVDLNLEQTFDHPDTRGWMNTFRRWAWADMFHSTYVISASTYGARFQTFCKQHLKLDVGELEIRAKSIPDKENLEGVEENLGLNEQIETHLLKQAVEELEGDIRAYVFNLRAGDRPFHVGFAVGTHAVGPENGVGSLRFFRIQNQVRTMGLGRRALTKLIREHNIIGCEPSPSMLKPTTDPNRFWVTEESSKRFQALFQSAWRQCREARLVRDCEPR